MVKLLKQSSISLHFEKHKGSTGGLQGTTNVNPVNDTQTKISSLTRRKSNIFLKPKDDAERMASGWMTVLEAGYRAKRFGKKTQSDGGSNSTTWGDITKKAKKMQIEALKEAYEELQRKCMKRISFPQ